MSVAKELPLALVRTTRRMESIDMVRGVIMLLMVIDHARDYFSMASGYDPTDPNHSWPALFATRWITHLCAPGFIALAGVSVYLQRLRGKSAGEMARLLVTRGLWLCFLEVTVVGFGWFFAPGIVLQVIWAIGVAMMFLAALQWLPPLAIGTIGGLIVVLHNLLDPINPDRFSSVGLLWTLVHQGKGPLFFHHQMFGIAAYPIVPWLGVICLGYAFGPVLRMTPERRQRVAVLLGAGMLLVFTLLRLTHAYGDHFRFEHLATPERTVMSFLDVEKYPPSLHYLLATLGVVVLMYALFDRAVSKDWLSRARGFVEIYGRVPLFFYVLHIYLLHSVALVWTAEQHENWRFWLSPYAVFIRHLPGWGYSLPVVYLVWLCTILALYLPCRWFSRYKAEHRAWWLSYL